MLTLFQVILNLILKEFDIIIQFCLLDGISVVTKSHHLIWECIDSFCFNTDISVEGICLDIDNTIINMGIYDSAVNYIHSLHIWTAMLDCLVHELTFLSHRFIHCLPFGLIVLTSGHSGDCNHQRHY